MSGIEEMLLAAQRDKQGQTIARAVERSRVAAGQSGEPDAAWSMGEKLLNALVFGSADQLEALGYSEAEAIDRLRYDFGATSEEFPAVLDRIRSEL
ncbi:hypothetical protein [Rhodococcus sp. IEGM 1408]|uniref:hypothetical protein n=1 Tax=Rhodococcus sp. IEGM 1408 TaxID=3082220 RepID=UPI0029553243|nr:hypothetical protein [Rhodococcus sp. IEGM 1408]MDV8003035.1 hypothetical protein [Rhodococcus sp. IEGM 1408]